MKLHYYYANCADEAMKVYGGHATHWSHTLVSDKARIWNWQSGPRFLSTNPHSSIIFFSDLLPSLSTATITSIYMLLIINHILVYAPNLYSHPVSAIDTHIYNSPLTLRPGCPISLYTYQKLKSYSSPKLFLIGWIPMRHHSFSPSYLVKHWVLMILPLKHFTLCTHFSQPSTVSCVFHIRSISLSGLL